MFASSTEYIIFPPFKRRPAIQQVASVWPATDHRILYKDMDRDKTSASELEGVHDESDAGQIHTPPCFMHMYTETSKVKYCYRVC